jgi:hypothetical protein
MNLVDLIRPRNIMSYSIAEIQIRKFEPGYVIHHYQNPHDPDEPVDLMNQWRLQENGEVECASNDFEDFCKELEPSEKEKFILHTGNRRYEVVKEFYTLEYISCCGQSVQWEVDGCGADGALFNDHAKTLIEAAIPFLKSEYKAGSGWPPEKCLLLTATIFTLWSFSVWQCYEGDWDSSLDFEGVIDMKKIPSLLVGSEKK